MHAVLEVLVVLLAAIYFILEAIVLGLIGLLSGTKRKCVKGQTVLITGAGSGLGRGVAVEFAKLGANVVLWDINEEGNEGTAELVREYGAHAYTYICDVSKREQIYRVAEKVKADVGNVDILVNNAGIVTGRKFLESPDSLIEKTMDVNINAHFWTCKQFLPGMIERKRGHLVTIASMAGHNGVTGLADYCASKHAAVGFDDSIRLELYGMGLHDIHTTVICPLYISTGMFEGVTAKPNSGCIVSETPTISKGLKVAEKLLDHAMHPGTPREKSNSFEIMKIADDFLAEYTAQNGTHSFSPIGELLGTEQCTAHRGLDGKYVVKFPFLLPIFKPEYVVDKIVSAVLTNKTTVLLPSYLGPITALKYLISTRLWLRVNHFLGICNIMDDFVGRKKND